MRKINFLAVVLAVFLVISSWSQANAFTLVPIQIVNTVIGIFPGGFNRLLDKHIDLLGSKQISLTGNTIVVHNPGFGFNPLTLQGQSRTFCYDRQGNQTGFFNGPATAFTPSADYAGGFDVSDNVPATSYLWTGSINIGLGYYSSNFNCSNNFSSFLDGSILVNLGIIADLRADIQHVEINHQNAVAVTFDRRTGTFFEADIAGVNIGNPAAHVGPLFQPPLGAGAIVSGLAEIPGTIDMIYSVNSSATSSNIYMFQSQFPTTQTILISSAQIRAHTGLGIDRVTAVSADQDEVFFFESFSDLLIGYNMNTTVFRTVATGQQISNLDNSLQPLVKDIEVDLNAQNNATKLLLLTEGNDAGGAGPFGAIIEFIP